MQISITLIIIVLTVLVSIQGFNSRDFSYRLSFSPYLARHHRQNYRFFTHMFVHADWGHLFFNMFSFYFFGTYMEKVLMMTYGLKAGSIHFLILYVIGGLFATLWPFVRNHNNENYYSLGASGAVSSIIFAFVLWAPQEDIYLFASLPIKAWIFGPLYLAIEFFAFRRGKTNIAHDAHIGGAFFGIIYILIINIDKGKELIQVIFN